MKLTRQERWILSNQYEILKAIYKDDRYDQWIDALNSGYEYEYDDLCAHIYKDETLSEGECIEVIHIMSMFSSLKYSYEKLADKSGIEEWSVKFPGFDGNNESAQLGYAKHLLKAGKFEDLDEGDGFNSHMPTLSAYRRMLAVHKTLDRKLDLSKDEITQITGAWKRPQ